MATDSTDLGQSASTTTQAGTAPAVDEVTPGQILSATRAQNGIDRDDAARSANLGVSIVMAMESDDFASLGLPVYARGYYRRYAKVIQCDADAVLSAYEQATDNPSPVPQIAQRPSIPYGGRSGGQKLLPFIALAIVAVLVAYLFFSSGGSDKQRVPDTGQDAVPAASAAQTETATMPTPTLAPLPDARALVEVDMQQALSNLEDAGSRSTAARSGGAATSTAASTNTLVPPNRLEIATGPQAAWIEVIDALGEKLAYRVVNPGERLIIEGDPPYSINLGMAHTLTLRYAGKPLDLRAVTDSASRARATIAANGEVLPR